MARIPSLAHLIFWRKAATSLYFADTPFKPITFFLGAFVVELRAAEDAEVAVVGCGQGLVREQRSVIYNCILQLYTIAIDYSDSAHTAVPVWQESSMVQVSPRPARGGRRARAPIAGPLASWPSH